MLRYPTTTDDERERAVSLASLSIQRGELVVIPTDTVYGLAADAFDSDAVTDLLEAKGRGRDMPPPVLVSSAATLDALAVRVPAWARALVAEFWPGPLTLVCHQQTSLQWDLGDTRGTVAVRMPDHPITLEILERTGPLAVSSANLTGSPAATDAAQAEEMLGELVAIIVDAGESAGAQASTIVDATGPAPKVLREGVLTQAQLDTVLRPLGLALSGEPPEPVVADEASDDDPVSLAKEPDAPVALEKEPDAPVALEKQPEDKAAAEPTPEPVTAPEVRVHGATRAPVKKRPVRRTTVMPVRSEPDPADPA